MNGTGSLRSHPSPAASDGVRKKRVPQKEAETRAKLMLAWLDPERSAQQRERNAKKFGRRQRRLSGLLDEDFDEMGA